MVVVDTIIFIISAIGSLIIFGMFRIKHNAYANKLADKRRPYLEYSTQITKRKKAKEEYLEALEAWERLNRITNGGKDGNRSHRIKLVDARAKRDFMESKATMAGVELVD